MTCPRFDFHIHTKYLGCANETMEVPAIIAECERLGATAIAITDHLNTPDQAELHAGILADINHSETDMDIYFGVELNFMSVDGPLALDDQLKVECGFQFAISGIHSTYLEQYDLTEIVDIQHRHHLATCRDPIVDVLVHPYWFGPREFDRKGFPVFDSMKHVPESYTRELGQLAAETGTAIEINAGANLVKGPEIPGYAASYIDYLAILAEQGVTFAVGSDAHDIGRLTVVQAAWDAADQLGLGPNRIWQPAAKPINKRA